MRWVTLFAFLALFASGACIPIELNNPFRKYDMGSFLKWTSEPHLPQIRELWHGLMDQIHIRSREADYHPLLVSKTPNMDDIRDTDPDLHLFPKPVEATFTDHPSRIVDAFLFSFSTESLSKILSDAMGRYTKILFENSPHGKPPNDYSDSDAHRILFRLQIHVKSDDETLTQGTDESYQLEITPESASIHANTVFGAMHALETFSQLVHPLSNDSVCHGVFIYEVPCVSIRDKPRFDYRGLMIDTSRHYLPLPIIYKCLDAMQFNKFNVLHWHIVDDPSFPYESKVFPDLMNKGAFNNITHIYTQEDIRHLIHYAKNRGIRVIPEFDTPGHTASWGLGYPELLTSCDDGTRYAIDPLNPNSYEFMTKFFEEVATVFDDVYIHTGGDEVSFDCWERNQAIQDWMKAHDTEDVAMVESFYESQLLPIIAANGNTPIVWQEVFNNGVNISSDTIVEVWKGFDETTLEGVIKSGHQAILSGCWYLDHLGTTPGHSDWIDFYSCDPYNVNASISELSLILGGEAAMWGEHVDGSNFMSRVWPRASAVAERLWSPRDVTDVDNAQIRLHNHRCRMVYRGIDAEPIMPGFCPCEWSG